MIRSIVAGVAVALFTNATIPALFVVASPGAEGLSIGDFGLQPGGKPTADGSADEDQAVVEGRAGLAGPSRWSTSDEGP